MEKRYMSVWFRHLTTDRWIVSQPELKDVPFVLAAPERGRMVIKAVNVRAEVMGIENGMVVADARAVLPALLVFDYKPGFAEKLLLAFGTWCIRFTPIVSVDPPDGLILDITGCTHLWGGERAYLKDIVNRIRGAGYDVRAAIADTIGTAWAVCRFGTVTPLIPPEGEQAALSALPPAALRLEADTLERMQKLGFYQIRNFMNIPRSVLRRRFGPHLLYRMDQALGAEEELIDPIRPVEPYQERLSSLEPIRTATGINIALRKLLEALCGRLSKEGKGLRKGVFMGYRMDGKIEQIEIGTNSASCHVEHLFRLFELKVSSIEPALGIELFILEAPVVEELDQMQETLWNITGNNNQSEITELLDRLTGRGGMQIVHRYLPDAHYWPERSVKEAVSIQEKPQIEWRTDKPRPVSLLPKPERIEVAALQPDYPPAVFRHQGKVYHIRKADGPERIEQEWWIEEGLHRDYYCVEDMKGARYWIFRLGHYNEDKEDMPEWFIHGFFA
ncbi:Y-family DNA polymerase [Dyadobacter bucti]|uniref:Y-family DNA polymerase n=1 Tax=Dyadobacter bucti TaxID=2572203 RepID=UPI0011098207|nr:DNA polymerase Y family protein [Dyadobacter bucti]